VAVWISLGFVTFAGYASCSHVKHQFVSTQRMSLSYWCRLPVLRV